MNDVLQTLMSPESIIQYGGILLLLIVIFTENGLFFGFFLPGDSLVFTAGLMVSTNVLNYHIYTIAIGIGISALAGNIVGYYFGKTAGNALYTRKNSFFFRKNHLEMAQSYYDKYGGRTLVISKFLPVIRTFAPIFAGLTHMKFGAFILYNMVGILGWVGVFLFSGYFLGKWVPNAEKYLGFIVIGLVVLTAIPVLTTVYKNMKQKSKAD